MARKSRKTAIQAVLDGRPQQTAESSVRQEVSWRAAGYARLSVLETRDRKESEALSNQKAILKDYIASRKELQFCGLYEDNGETGTNFERSDFQRMMTDVQAGKINCIVVKDDCVIIELNAESPIKCGFCAVSSIFLTQNRQRKNAGRRKEVGRPPI